MDDYDVLTLCRGHAVVFAPGEFAHRVGGSSDWFGADCPNCAKPFICFLTLDTADPVLPLQDSPYRRLPILTCPRCNVWYGGLTYRVFDDGLIQLIRADQGASKDAADQWDDDIGRDELDRAPVSLTPLPKRFEKLQTRLYADGRSSLSTKQQIEYNSVAARFAGGDPAGDIFPMLFNQVGGRPHLPQGAYDEECTCGRAMSPLALLCNHKSSGFQIAGSDDVHLISWFCPPCHHVSVTHKCT